MMKQINKLTPYLNKHAEDLPIEQVFIDFSC